MIKIDLITGFLGSGKTTFLRKYASYLIYFYHFSHSPFQIICHKLSHKL